MVKKTPIVGLPDAKQQRGRDTIDAVLTATAKVLSKQGEGKVRIQEISSQTGVSIGSIYHHFKNREGLILAALVDAFSKGFRRDLENMVNWLDSVNEIAQLTQDTDRIRGLIDKHWAEADALHRISILGSVQGRRELKAALTKVQTELFDRLAQSIERLQGLGFIKSNLSTRAVSVHGIGMILGRAISEIDATPVSSSEWNQVVLEMLSGLIPLELLVQQRQG